MGFIDGHTHVFAPGQIARRGEITARDATFAELYADPKARMSDAPGLLAALDEAGIEAAVVAGFAFSNARDIAEQNEYILAAAAESQGRLLPLATVNLALPKPIRTADRMLAQGALGFGELRPHNQGWEPSGPAARKLHALASEAGAVLLWHVTEPVGHLYAGKGGGIGPGELARVAEAYPQLRMVAAPWAGPCLLLADARTARCPGERVLRYGGVPAAV
jgi:predicted TIM-barrel fold metal-dependent hydrolase